MEFENATKSFSSAGTPLVKNRETGEQNNSNGETTTITQQKKNHKQNITSLSSNLLSMRNQYQVEGQSVLRYPLDRIPELGYDYVTFTAYEYKAGSLISSTGEERISGNPQRLKSVFLSFPTSKRQMVLIGVRIN